jgi:signal peptidase I
VESPPSRCRLSEESNGAHRYVVLHEPDRHPPNYPGLVVPPGRVFVMGDNRDNSNDSRMWGTLPLELIKGKALFVWWSQAPGGEVRWGRIGQPVR